MSAISAKFELFEKYSHDRWHDLANDLQPLVALPVQIARDFGKLEGRIRGEMASTVGSIEKTVADAVAKAIEPLSRDFNHLKEDVGELQNEVDDLKKERHRMTGARMLLVWAVQTMIATAVAAAAILSLMK